MHFWFENKIIQITNIIKRDNNIGESGAKYIEESVKKLKNLEYLELDFG